MKRCQECLVEPTHSSSCFTIEGNNITKSAGGSYYRMVLLDAQVGVGVFSFRARIHSTKGWMLIGVTDKVTQKGRDSSQSKHGIEYCCGSGEIYYGTDDRKWSK